jgi:hypothetical protein
VASPTGLIVKLPAAHTHKVMVKLKLLPTAADTGVAVLRMATSAERYDKLNTPGWTAVSHKLNMGLLRYKQHVPGHKDNVPHSVPEAA